jgi:hypothetical protein
MKSNRLMTSLNSRISYCFYKGFLKKKIRTQYTYQLLSIVLCSTWVNSYLLVILYGELLLNKIVIYGVKTDEVLVLNLTKSKSIHHIIFFQFQLTNFSFSILYIVLDWSNGNFKAFLADLKIYNQFLGSTNSVGLILHIGRFFSNCKLIQMIFRENLFLPSFHF